MDNVEQNLSYVSTKSTAFRHFVQYKIYFYGGLFCFANVLQSFVCEPSFCSKVNESVHIALIGQQHYVTVNSLVLHLLSHTFMHA